jgi:serine/threonine protein kinase
MGHSRARPPASTSQPTRSHTRTPHPNPHAHVPLARAAHPTPSFGSVHPQLHSPSPLLQGGLTLGQVLHVVVQVVTGLLHLHLLGVLHRDLRTSNILVDSREPLQVQLADVGVSHVLRQLAGAVGTVGYEGLRLLSVGEAVHGRGALGTLMCPSRCVTVSYRSHIYSVFPSLRRCLP